MTAHGLRFVVDPNLCTRCKSCVLECPMRILEMKEEQYPGTIADKEERCIGCQHCLAVCPEGAVSIGGFSPQNSRRVSPFALPSLDQMDLFVRARRSVRNYRDEKVDDALIDRLLDAAAHAPTGVNFGQLTFTVIEDRAALDDRRKSLLQGLSDAAAAGRLNENAEMTAGTILAAQKDGRDIVFRGAPHLLIVSSPPYAPCAEQDIAIALSYFELLAKSAGLGAVWCGYLRLLLELVPECKPLFQIPEGYHYYAMLFGVPAVRFHRTAQRGGSATVQKIREIS